MTKALWFSTQRDWSVVSADRREELVRTEPLLRRLTSAGTELVIVMGPKDDDCDGAHWVGAVLSVTGRIKNVPTLEQAVNDGLFTSSSGRYLAAFDPRRASPERIAEARLRTKEAVAAMEARARGEVTPKRRKSEIRLAPSEQAFERAKVFAKDTRLKFERVYASARRALDSGDNKTALSKCRAALQLLEQEALYGSRQDELIRALTEQIEHLANSEHEQEAS